MEKILIVEDDVAILESIRDVLKAKDYLVQTAQDGAEALGILEKSQPDLLLLDLGLPKITGESVCQEAKKRYPDMPIIILTAKNQTADLVRGFQIGADDYIRKPFELEELLARIKAKLRPLSDGILSVSDLQLYTDRFEAKRGGETIALSPHEFKLLWYLMSNKEQVLTREMILNRVWGYASDVDSRVVDVYIGYLRKKIDTSSPKKLIHAVRGFGYVIKE